MRQSASHNPHARKKDRAEIALHINEFLKKGGDIEYVSSNQCAEKPLGSIWQEAFPPEIDV